jgi:hypothetical protein
MVAGDGMFSAKPATERSKYFTWKRGIAEGG